MQVIPGKKVPETLMVFYNGLNKHLHNPCVLAGGYPLNLVYKPKLNSSDIDFFIPIKGNEELVSEPINWIENTLYEFLSSHKFSMKRRSALDFLINTEYKSPKTPVQHRIVCTLTVPTKKGNSYDYPLDLIFRDFENVNHLIENFNLTVNQVYIDESGQIKSPHNLLDKNFRVDMTLSTFDEVIAKFDFTSHNSYNSLFKQLKTISRKIVLYNLTISDSFVLGMEELKEKAIKNATSDSVSTKLYTSYFGKIDQIMSQIKKIPEVPKTKNTMKANASLYKETEFVKW